MDTQDAPAAARTVDLRAVLKDFTGAAELRPGGRTLTLKDLLVLSMSEAMEGDNKLDSDVKARIFCLGVMFAIHDEIALEAADVVLVLERAARLFPAITYGQILAALDRAQFERMAGRVGLVAGNPFMPPVAG